MIPVSKIAVIDTSAHDHYEKISINKHYESKRSMDFNNRRAYKAV
jgi:hypothetical protein